MPVPTSSSDIERRSLRDVAAERIRAAIFDGTLAPGEHLNDGELQDWLGMSRTPIREALNDLARIGLIEMAAQRYTRVALPDPQKRTEVLQTIGAMLGGVVRVTVPTLSPAQKKPLLRSLGTVLTALPKRDADEVTSVGWTFVQDVIEACPNQSLVTATKDIVNALSFRIAATNAVDDVPWDVLDEGFAQLRDAIDAGDAVQAELAIESIYRLGELG
ncbi:GntR family transcriptional regulator [Plantibacter flavus]|uniref:GntR family transcriptional regulator n=1 Tax=Plantibacter flavus TaxID=150123 RepID=UPI003F13E99D